MVAFELKEIPQHMRIKTKPDLNKTIYNYRMQAQTLYALFSHKSKHRYKCYLQDIHHLDGTITVIFNISS